ncbi:ABH15-like protein [Mya arenaria]|uniref:ABH15-like protein n=1 Tax=Mya arenaria TaxID=6604 RepID=A0ABY7DXC9_MYAAR|nr:ABH15-like protein [Mya arenaria]WAR01342.1 ABH15-like protein [Mya arenaria]
MFFAVYSGITSIPIIVAIFGTIIVSGFIYVSSFLKPSSTIPKLYFKESALASHLLKRCRLMNRKFDPPWYLRNEHVQTIVSYLIPKISKEFDREYLQIKDRGVVALDWALHVSVYKRKRCTVLIILPGLTASAYDVSNMCSLAAHKGFRPVVFNPRGFGNSVLTTAKILSTGDPYDMREVVKYIHGRFPKALVSMVGYGTGCSIMLSYLGEFGSSANICASACISACFDSPERISKGIQGIYDIFYMLKLKFILNAHSKTFSKIVNFHELLNCWSYKRFEEILYSKLYNISSVDDFIERNNPLRDADEIAVPLLFINSLDDPFYSKMKIPYELCKYYPHILMVSTNKGGHCGFIDKLWDVSWAETLALDYLDSVLDFTNKGHRINYEYYIQSVNLIQIDSILERTLEITH